MEQASMSTQSSSPPVSLHTNLQHEAAATTYRVLTAVSVGHLLNDMNQSILPSIYPILKNSFHLRFSQLGLLTLVFQITASVLQPFIGFYTDKHPKPYSLPLGVLFACAGVLLLAFAGRFDLLLVSAALIGIGSAIFHPESSRVARAASGGQHGMAQSLFQLGGTFGQALGPLAAALIVLPFGQRSIAVFVLGCVISFFLLSFVARWYKAYAGRTGRDAGKTAAPVKALPNQQIAGALVILVALIFSKYFYLASLSSYYTFYLIGRFGTSVGAAQLYLFLFLAAAAAGTMIGGPVGDRVGRKLVIWISIVGVLPFTLVLPYANLFWTAVLTVIIGLVLSSAFSAILVYGQELLPGRVGMISGLLFGLAFGMGGIGAACLGKLADYTNIEYVYKLCSFLPLIGLLTAFLPNIEQERKAALTHR